LFDSRLDKQVVESACSGPISARTCCLEMGFLNDTSEAGAAHRRSYVGCTTK
jgi:hypothetical protein